MADNEWALENTLVWVNVESDEHEFGVPTHSVLAPAELALFYDQEEGILLHVVCPYFTTMIPLPKWIQMS